jgi:hypothetical protein
MSDIRVALSAPTITISTFAESDAASVFAIARALANSFMNAALSAGAFRQHLGLSAQASHD